MAEKKKGILGKLLLAGLGALAVKGGIDVYRRYKDWSEYEDSLSDEPNTLDIERIKKFAKEGLFVHDTDGDGRDDTVFMDTTGDGKIDTALVDTDGDGQVDTAVLDTTGDGQFDTVITEG